MVTAFLLAYFGFMVGYPFLQLWTLLRCRGWWRAAALFCLIPAAPFYVFSAMDFLGYFSSGSLLGLVVGLVGPVPMSYLAIVALGYERSRRRRNRETPLKPAPVDGVVPLAPSRPWPLPRDDDIGV